jgi:hypothetical protein
MRYDGEYQITVEIESGMVRGNFPPRALKHVQEWRNLNKNELLQAWNAVQAGRQPAKIKPLE